MVMATRILRNNPEVSTEALNSAIDRAIELRAFRTSLAQATSPSNLRLTHSTSPNNITQHSSRLSGEEYPIFTPSYKDETLPRYLQFQTEIKTFSEDWDDLGSEGTKLGETSLFESQSELLSPSTGLLCSSNNHESRRDSWCNHIDILKSPPNIESINSHGRTSNGELDLITSCNKCKPAKIKNEIEDSNEKIKKGIASPINYLQSETKNRGKFLTWIFHKSKKKFKHEDSQSKLGAEETSQIFKDWGILSMESLKRELMEANQMREDALMEVKKMRTNMSELSMKVIKLESYCDELKGALKQGTQKTETRAKNPEKMNFTKRGNSSTNGRGNRDVQRPVSHEPMVEGFFQIVFESRLSVKQFCKSLRTQIEEDGNNLTGSISSTNHSHNLAPTSKHSKVILYHLEALVNKSLFEDFENCMFQKNGSPKILDPQLDRESKFSSFITLRNLSWNEVLIQGTKYYSEEFSKFCDQKMSGIISILNWSRPWHEQLLQSFFTAAKCIWLLHLLAFSFNPPLMILRVAENTDFDSIYMEDIFSKKERIQVPCRVKIMVMPGFYVREKALKCKVLCRYPNGAHPF